MCLTTECFGIRFDSTMTPLITQFNLLQTIQESCVGYRELFVRMHEFLTWQKPMYAHTIIGLNVARYT